MLSGNKGEWSEVYVLMKLLAEGTLYAADSNLNFIPDLYFPVLKILRLEHGSNREYLREVNIQIIDGNTKQLISTIKIADFIQYSRQLFELLKTKKGLSFGVPELDLFLKEIEVKSLSASKHDKSDIKVVVHDLRTGQKPELGFSIKSMLGKNATLFNSSKATNFIYEIINAGPLEINSINAIIDEPKISNRINEIKKFNGQLIFKDIESNNFKLNLQLIDGDLPKIISEILLLKYSSEKINSIKELTTRLNELNPLQYDLSRNHPFYEHKIKSFLTDTALGMTPSSTWDGKYDATGGIIIVKDNGDLVCYHIYNRNEFQNYLFNNTRLEQASTSRYDFGLLFQNEKRFYFKLNLQVRFK